MRVKLPLLPKMSSDGLLLVNKFPVSVDGVVERVGIMGGAQEGWGGDLKPRGSEIKSAH